MTTGPSLVAIGGTLCDRRIWTPVLKADDDVTIIVAGQVDGKTTDCTDMAAYVQDLLKSLPERFVLLGFSLGGLIALEMMAQGPGRIAGLALVCAGVGGETQQGAAARRRDQDLASAKGMTEHARTDLWPRLGARNDLARETYAAMAESVGLDLYRRQNDLAMSRRDSTRSVERIAGPVLLVSGARDALCPPSRHEAVAGSIPNSTRVVIDDAGHMIAFDQPARLADVLYEWMADTGPSAVTRNGARDQHSPLREKA